MLVLSLDEDETFLNMVRDELLEDKDVEFAACHREHPEVDVTKLIVKVKKGKPKSAVISAAKKVGKKIEEFKKAFAEAKKKAKK